jgi:hypothetical protein
MTTCILLILPIIDHANELNSCILPLIGPAVVIPYTAIAAGWRESGAALPIA